MFDVCMPSVFLSMWIFSSDVDVQYVELLSASPVCCRRSVHVAGSPSDCVTASRSVNVLSALSRRTFRDLRSCDTVGEWTQKSEAWSLKDRLQNIYEGCMSDLESAETGLLEMTSMMSLLWCDSSRPDLCSGFDRSTACIEVYGRQISLSICSESAPQKVLVPLTPAPPSTQPLCKFDWWTKKKHTETLTSCRDWSENNTQLIYFIMIINMKWTQSLDFFLQVPIFNSIFWI